MASWSSKRKLAYITTFSVVVLAVLVSLYFLLFYKQPTCFDGIQNGNESGVDCGGGCSNVCDFEVSDPNVLWARSFEVLPDNYSAVAYIENSNIDAEAFDVPYVFKFFDENNILVYEKKGRVYIPPKTSFVVYESGINTNARKPKYTFFEFEESPDWQKTKYIQNPLKLKNHTLNTSQIPIKLDAVIENPSLKDIKNIEVVAILYSASGNVLTASRTIIDKIDSEGEESIVFTWPRELSEKAIRVEIVPMIKP